MLYKHSYQTLSQSTLHFIIEFALKEETNNKWCAIPDLAYRLTTCVLFK